MSKRQIVVAVHQQEMITNVQDLPPRFSVKGEDSVIIMHSKPEAIMVNNEMLCNFDFLINATGLETSVIGTSYDWLHAVPKHKVINSIRSAKWELQNLIKEFSERNTMPILTFLSTHYGKHDRIRSQGNNLSPWKRYVLKAPYGARGMGQFKFKPEDVSLEQILKAIVTSETHEGLTDSLNKIKGFENVVYSTGLEFKEGESFTILNNTNFVIQELIENIVKEYRIILRHEGDGVGWLCHERKLVVRENSKNDKYIQASIDEEKPLSQKEVESDKNDFLLNLNDDERKLLDDLFLKLLNKYGPLLSVDMFVTKQGQIGIFEISNQFSVVDFGERVCNEFTKHAIVEAIKLKEKEETLGNF